MSEFYAFASENPFLTWFLAWGLWPICSMIGTIATAPFRYPYLAYNRRLRARNIQARGWPTAPLMDADGDIVHPKKD